MSLRDLVVVTGMSGSGKGTVLKAFEDLGFFCIDNLPVPLIPKFVEGIHVSGGDVERAAFVVDIRAGEKLQTVEKLLVDLKTQDFRLYVLYLEASDEVLLRRFSETRRPHPLGVGKPLLQSIRLERKRLRKIRELADATLDTSEYNVHQVKARVMKQFRTHPRESRLDIHVVSFGYKHGAPLEADLLFDVRFLPNPYFVEGLRKFSGRHPKVMRYLRSFPETVEFMKRLKEFLDYLISAYIKEGRSYLTIGIGCTGGKHRSVFVAEAISKKMRHRNVSIRVRHRDEKK
jgi:RNase adapter protein RapZ